MHVGEVRWSGRISGNHERGIGAPRKVEFLKGVNLAIRKEFFPIPNSMRLEGPEPHWEVYLCQRALKRGFTVVYDPQVLVAHFPGIRHELDRHANSKLAFVYNRNLVLAFGLNRSFLCVFRIIVYQLLIGRSPSFGIARIFVAIGRKENFGAIWLSSVKGLMSGISIVKGKRN